MSENTTQNKNDEADAARGEANFNDRRTFLKIGSAGLAALTFGGASRKTVFGQGQQTINLGSGDIEIMNFAFLLEQLEADFYTRVVASEYLETEFYATG
jgi:hypothetical protein